MKVETNHERYKCDVSCTVSNLKFSNQSVIMFFFELILYLYCTKSIFCTKRKKKNTQMCLDVERSDFYWIKANACNSCKRCVEWRTLQCRNIVENIKTHCDIYRQISFEQNKSFQMIQSWKLHICVIHLKGFDFRVMHQRLVRRNETEWKFISNQDDVKSVFLPFSEIFFRNDFSSLIKYISNKSVCIFVSKIDCARKKKWECNKSFVFKLYFI